MISITTAVAAYAVVITVLYLIVQARVDEYDAEARDRAARRAELDAWLDGEKCEHQRETQHP